jgi:hypothetical protein
MRRLLAPLVVLLVLATTVAAHARTVTTFSDPNIAPYAIVDTELRAINGVAAGGIIDLANPLMDCQYADPLIAAAQRGVHVRWYTLERKYAKFPCGPKLADFLRATPGSFVRVCLNSCYDESLGSMHSKTLQVTYRNGIRRTVIGSNDWTHRVPYREWNAGVTTFNRVIGAAVHRWFEGMRLRKPASYFPKQVTADGMTLYQYPNLDQSGTHNVYLDTLHRVSCTHGHTRVYVKTSQWQPVMLPVVDRLGWMQAHGCRIRIIGGYRTTATVVHRIHHYGLIARESGSVSADGRHHVWSHVKEILVQTHYQGRYTRLDLLGSGNMGQYWSGENNMIRLVPDADDYARSLEQFQRIWRVSHTAFRSVTA